MWFSFSDLFCGSFGRAFNRNLLSIDKPPQAPPESLLGDATKQQPVSTETKPLSKSETKSSTRNQPIESGDFKSSQSMPIQENSSARQLVINCTSQSNEAQLDQLKMDFFHHCRPKNAIPLSDREILKYHEEREMLKLKANYLNIRPSPRFVNTPLQSEQQRGLIASCLC